MGSGTRPNTVSDPHKVVAVTVCPLGNDGTPGCVRIITRWSSGRGTFKIDQISTSVTVAKIMAPSKL